jgi:hypothetical protein
VGSCCRDSQPAGSNSLCTFDRPCEALVRAQKGRMKIIKTVLQDTVREVI